MSSSWSKPRPGLCVGAAVLSVVSCVCSVSCSQKPYSTTTYRIGYGGDRPLHYQDADGKPTGLAVAVVQEAAKRRGIHLEWVPATNALEDLQAGRIDLFVLLTALPEREKLIYLSRPYLATEMAFLVPQQSIFSSVDNLAVARIAFNNLEVQRLAVRRQLPNSIPVSVASTAEAIAAMQDGRADAAYVDQYAGIIGLLDGAAKESLRIIPSGTPVRQLALGANFQHQNVAEDIRDEIGALAERQELASVLAHWSMFPILMAESADALNEERRKVRLLGQGAVGLAALLTIVLFLVLLLRRRARSLTESEGRFRNLVEAAFEGIMIHDGIKILDANEQFARLFGYAAPSELIGPGAPTKLLDEESERLVRDRMGSAPNFKPIEIVGIRKDGSTFRAETQGCDSIFKGRKVRVVAMRDIGDRKRLEEERKKLESQLAQAQKMESIGRLAGGVAHDFNNLLTVINGYSGLVLQDQNLTDRVRKRVESVHKAGERAAELTSQLLAFSRKQVIEPKPLNLNTLVTETKAMLGRVIPENIEIVCCLKEDLALVLADPGQMHQVLLNLVLNARDAMPNGGKLLLETQHVMLDARRASEHPEAVEGPCVMLAVTDTGVGMSPEVAEHIFEPFFTTKAAHAGTGLGLATAYGIMRQNGGWIWVYSELGKGTTFKIFLPPLLSVPELQVVSVASHPHLGSETILVVEDQAELRSLVAEVLEGKGYKVLCAANGDAAMAFASGYAEPIDLLLTDVVMPGISGKELAEKLQAQRPSLKVLYMSGYTENVIVNRGILKPGIVFLPKPLTPETLLAKVDWVLRQ